jgi:hypothetical protein
MLEILTESRTWFKYSILQQAIQNKDHLIRIGLAHVQLI